MRRRYADEVRQKFEIWRRLYVTLPARAALQDVHSDQSPTAPFVVSIPRYFHPRGFRLTYCEPSASEPGKKPQPEDFDDVRDALAKAGDAVLLGEPGIGKTTSF